MRRVHVFAEKILPGALGLTKVLGIRLSLLATGRFLVMFLILYSLGCSKPEKAAPKAHLKPEVKVPYEGT